MLYYYFSCYIIAIYSGKISIQVLREKTDVGFGDNAREIMGSVSDIFEHYKLNESAHEFSRQLLQRHNRIKYTTMRSQKKGISARKRK